MRKALRFLAIAAGLVIFAYLTFMALLLVAVLVLRPGEAPMDEVDLATPPLPLSFRIQLGYSREVANRDFELRLDAQDVATLQLVGRDGRQQQLGRLRRRDAAPVERDPAGPLPARRGDDRRHRASRPGGGDPRGHVHRQRRTSWSPPQTSRRSAPNPSAPPTAA